MKPLPKLQKCQGESCQGCSSSACMAEGGEVKKEEAPKKRFVPNKNIKVSASEPTKEELEKYREEKWANDASDHYTRRYAEGGYIANPTEAQARSGYAVHKDEGGEIDMDGDSDADDSIMNAVSTELMESLEKKDKKGILEAIRAIVLSCKE